MERLRRQYFSTYSKLVGLGLNEMKWVSQINPALIVNPSNFLTFFFFENYLFAKTTLKIGIVPGSVCI